MQQVRLTRVAFEAREPMADQEPYQPVPVIRSEAPQIEIDRCAMQMLAVRRTVDPNVVSGIPVSAHDPDRVPDMPVPAVAPPADAPRSVPLRCPLKQTRTDGSRTTVSPEPDRRCRSASQHGTTRAKWRHLPDDLPPPHGRRAPPGRISSGGGWVVRRRPRGKLFRPGYPAGMGWLRRRRSTPRTSQPSARIDWPTC